MKLETARRYALSLPEATEEPHHHMSSFRVKGKIFATVPPEGTHLHVFIDDALREQMVTLYPDAFENLWWGEKIAGIRVVLAKAGAPMIEKLLLAAWMRKAPKSLSAAYRAR